MSYRAYGRAVTDPSNPRAHAICDRCGARYNHMDLKWQYDWRGTKLQNLRFLVCESCLDSYQQNGQRTIILPQDPEPIMNARPENYVAADNPLSALGANPDPRLNLFSAQTGTMTNAAGVPAAFDGNTNKPSWMSAMISRPGSSFDNWVGINWAEYPAGTYPLGIDVPVIKHTLASWQIYAPNDSIIGSSSYLIQGSNAPTNAFGSWTTLAGGSIANFNGEGITGSAGVGGTFQFHRAAFWGGSGFPIAVAQVRFNVLDAATMTTS
jgi:hypothetical protein